MARRKPSLFGKRTRRGGRRGGRSKGVLRKILLITTAVGVPVAALVGGGILAIDHMNTEQISANYCYARADQHDAAVFVDFSLTDRTSQSQRRDLRNALLDAFASLPANGRIAVFTTASTSSSTLSVPVFTLCNPADTAAELASIDAPAVSPPRLARLNEEADEAFASFVDDLLAQSTDAGQVARNSPILEQVRGVSRYGSDVGLDHFILYSDGINNSPVAQFCAVQGHLPRFEVFAQRPDWREVAPDSFQGADVDVLLVEQYALPIPGLEYCTNRELRDFWVDLFEASGASRVRLTPLGYGSGT